MDPKQMSSLSGLFSELNTRINDLEEKQNSITERLTLLSQTLLNTAQRLGKESKTNSEEIAAMKDALLKLRTGLNTIIEQSADFVRKQELQYLDKYIKNWQPMKFATIEDVKKIVSDTMKNKKVSSKDKIIPVDDSE